MASSNPFDNLAKVFGLPKMALQSVAPAFPYQTTPPKAPPPTVVNPQGVGLPPGLGAQPLGGDPMRGLVPKDSDLMMQGLMQAMGQMAGGAAPGQAPPPGEEMQGETGGEPLEAPTEEAPQEVRQMRGEEQPQTTANLPPPNAPREPVPYLPSKRR